MVLSLDNLVLLNRSLSIVIRSSPTDFRLSSRFLTLSTLVSSLDPLDTRLDSLDIRHSTLSSLDPFHSPTSVLTHWSLVSLADISESQEGLSCNPLGRTESLLH